MATNKQQEAARRNIGQTRQAQSARAHGGTALRRSEGMNTADKDKPTDQEFAFPEERKEPLTDAFFEFSAAQVLPRARGI